jgi:hypothetical protein
MDVNRRVISRCSCVPTSNHGRRLDWCLYVHLDVTNMLEANRKASRLSHGKQTLFPLNRAIHHHPVDIQRQFALLRLITLPSILLPIHPTPLILRNTLITHLSRQFRRRGAPHACPAVKHQLLIGFGLAETKAVFKLVGRQEQGIRLRFHRDVDRAGDEAFLVFGGFADVCGVCELVCKGRGFGGRVLPIIRRSFEGELANSLICLKS